MKEGERSSVAELTLWHWTVPEYLVFQGNSTALCQPVGKGSLIRPITKQLMGQLSIMEAWPPTITELNWFCKPNPDTCVN